MLGYAAAHAELLVNEQQGDCRQYDGTVNRHWSYIILIALYVGNLLCSEAQFGRMVVLPEEDGLCNGRRHARENLERRHLDLSKAAVALAEEDVFIEIWSEGDAEHGRLVAPGEDVYEVLALVVELYTALVCGLEVVARKLDLVRRVAQGNVYPGGGLYVLCIDGAGGAAALPYRDAEGVFVCRNEQGIGLAERNLLADLGLAEVCADHLFQGEEIGLLVAEGVLALCDMYVEGSGTKIVAVQINLAIVRLGADAVGYVPVHQGFDCKLPAFLDVYLFLCGKEAFLYELQHVPAALDAHVADGDGAYFCAVHQHPGSDGIFLVCNGKIAADGLKGDAEAGILSLAQGNGGRFGSESVRLCLYGVLPGAQGDYSALVKLVVLDLCVCVEAVDVGRVQVYCIAVYVYLGIAAEAESLFCQDLERDGGELRNEGKRILVLCVVGLGLDQDRGVFALVAVFLYAQLVVALEQ